MIYGANWIKGINNSHEKEHIYYLTQDNLRSVLIIYIWT